MQMGSGCQVLDSRLRGKGMLCRVICGSVKTNWHSAPRQLLIELSLPGRRAF